MLAVDLGSEPPLFDEEYRMSRPEDVVKLCGSLVRIDTNPEGRNSLGEIATVRTLTAAHASVVDFLKAQPVLIGPQSETFFTKGTVNLKMAETCVTYLLYFVDANITLRYDNIMNYPFARLSAELWDDFYREAVASSGEEEVDMTRLNNLAMRLFSSPEIILKWVQLCDPDDDTDVVDFDKKTWDLGSALYYAALLGLPEIVRRLIKSGHNVNEDGKALCGTPLVAACVYGREKIVSILLEEGADPNLCTLYGCPLAAAIERNQADIVKLLLETSKAEVNGRRFPPESGSTIITPNLQKAREMEHTDHKLLQEDALPDGDERKDDDDLGPSTDDEGLVYIAAQYGSLEILDTLLAAGANPNIRGGAHCTAIKAACRRGNVEMVQTLLEHGADPMIYRGSSFSAMQEACASKSLPIVKLLIGYGVDVNIIGKRLSILYGRYLH